MKIFLCEPIDNDTYKLLNSQNEIFNNFNDIGKCEIIISRNLKIDKDFIDQCTNLKLIIIHGSGYDDVDTKYCKEKHIHLCNTPNLNALGVSELIISMMLSLSRNTYQLQNDYISNKIHEVALSTGQEISYKTFGMIGVGNIALKTAQILQNGFHMNIIGYSRSLSLEKANSLHIGYCASMEEVFKKADYISIGLSLNNDTYHLIDSYYLSLMKSTAYIINTSRGAIINEDDLYDALLNHKIAGAGIDVLENEPVNYNHRLLQLNNIIYTPHIGGSTEESLERIGQRILEIIHAYKNGRVDDYTIF
ncbi:MAG: hypothetical protein LUG60_09595 [Erysipelotrichaceae bacterium]|nr:hypothetical protein [Erysipelotrichaceae bacterium]